MKILLCFGTRPEAIKMAPVINVLKDQGIDHRICVTAQHREMLDQVLNFFSIKPDYDLDLMKPGQNLNLLSAEIFNGVNKVLDQEKPDIVLVQGDTTTAFVTAMAAFNSRIKIGHIEAGLRTYNMNAPYPEEANRQLISRIADVHFVPTKTAGLNLKNELIPESKIFETGNTIVDALELGKASLSAGYENQDIQFFNGYLDPDRKLILITGHRRENFEKGLSEICEAVIEIAKRDDVQVIFPVHPNPQVQKIVGDKLQGIDNIYLTKPLNYPTLLWLMNKCEFIISDSGGIQEEAPGFNKRVLVTRDFTERPEGVEAGFSILTGASQNNIVKESLKLLENRINLASVPNPFGDGKASLKTVQILKNLYQKELKLM